MKVKVIEWGNTYTIDKITPYTSIYTQPLHNVIISWLYHNVWERVTWRLYRKIEKLTKQNKRTFTEDLYIPLTNRQDLRCYYLHHKNRIVISTTYGDARQRSDMDGNMDLS